MAFKRLATLEPLKLPIGDRIYEIEPVDADLGLFLTEFSAAMAAARVEQEATGSATVHPAQAERLQQMSQQLQGEDTLARMLGADTLAQMRADGVPWKTIQLVAHTVMTWTVSGLEEAEVFWNSGGRPKAPNRAQRRQRAKPKG
ncbi:hypothetical protein [uncultured Aeromicrobium sp.]|uniref:DUF7426 family protein n=1 Tax=uncultured Aeromicrobium sp. TaxID=337820 RepID=UPI0025FC5DFC|nr:hypothetical protein [uncultured Aeromicrobium sp.]